MWTTKSANGDIIIGASADSAPSRSRPILTALRGPLAASLLQHHQPPSRPDAPDTAHIFFSCNSRFT